MKRKLILSSMIIILALLCLETAFANRQSISLLISDVTEHRLDFENAVYGSGTKLEGEAVTVKNGGFIKFQSIEAETKTVAIETVGCGGIYTLTFEKNDDYSRFKAIKTSDFRIFGDGVHVFDLPSDGKLVNLTIRFQTGSNFTVKSVSVNTCPAFEFNILRFAVLAIICIGISAVLIFGSHKVLYSQNTSSAVLFVIPLIICLLFTCLSTVKQVGFHKYPLEDPISEYDEYTQLFDAFHKGQTNLSIPFDEEAYSKLNNPYDYYERKEKLGSTGALWDRAYYNGKIYCYFGAAPVITVYYPVYILTGFLPKEGTASLILTLEATAAIIFLLFAMLRHYKINPPVLLLALGTATLCTSSMIYVLNAHPSMYYNAVLSGVLFLALTMNFSYRAFDTQSCLRRNIFLVLTAISAVGVAASRPALLLFAVALAPLYIKMMLGKDIPLSARVKSVLSFGLPLLAGAIVIMAYNNARFGSVFDFGNTYQLTFNDTSRNTLTLSLLLPALFHYFIQPPAFFGHFPYAGLSVVNLGIYGRYMYVAGSVGVMSFPANMGIFGIFTTKKDKSKRFTFVYLLACAAAVAFADLCMAGIHIRYIGDIGFPIALVGIITLLELGEEKKQKSVFWGIAILFTLSLMMSFALLFDNEADNLMHLAPSVYSFFEKLFS